MIRCSQGYIAEKTRIRPVVQAYFSALGDVKTFNLDPDSFGEIVNGKRTYFIEYFDDRCASKAFVDITQAEVRRRFDMEVIVLQS